VWHDDSGAGDIGSRLYNGRGLGYQIRLLVRIVGPIGQKMMKVIRIFPYVLLAATLAGVVLYWYGHRASLPLSTVPVEVKEAHGAAPAVLPIAAPMDLPAVEVRVAEEPMTLHKPAQTLEERGDAMLFEIDALQGTPFDQAIVAPFE
jgi:hypothetical protein